MTLDHLEAYAKIAFAIFMAGVLWAEMKAVRRDLARLEKKQDTYNHLQERTACVEQEVKRLVGLPEQVARIEDSVRAAHKRITEQHYEHLSN